MIDKKDISTENRFRSVVKVQFKKKRKPFHNLDTNYNKQLTEDEIKKKQDLIKRAEEQVVVQVTTNVQDLEQQKRRAAFFGDRKMLKEIRNQYQSRQTPSPNRPFNPNRPSNLDNNKSRFIRPTRPGDKPFPPRFNKPPLGTKPPTKIRLNEFKISQVMSQINQQAKNASTVRKQVKKPIPKQVDNSKNKSKLNTSTNQIQLGHRFLGEIKSADDVDINFERTRSISSFRRSLEKQKRSNTQKNTNKVMREIIVFDQMEISTLAHLMAISLDTVIAKARQLGLEANRNDKLSIDESYILVEEFGHKYKKRVEVLDTVHKDIGELQDYTPRSPIVTVVGHVDHGKTSLLDALRATQFVNTESGGITQSIGASQVTTESGNSVTFIDTPGHEIFTEMRARGVNITDIVLLIIAADDGIKEQTIESIQHAQAAKSTIIVVITKSDKGGNTDKIKQMLMSHNIVVESLGGDVPDIAVSAKTGHNLKELLELILLQAEMLDLKSNSKAKASGHVIEAYMDKNLGPTATVLVQNGTLLKGDTFLCGMTYGRVRSMSNWLGKQVNDAGASVPVKVSGFGEVPVAGDEFIVMQESHAKEASMKRKELSNVANFSILKAKSESSYSVMDIWKELTGDKGPAEFCFIIKADSSGSCEAINAAIEKLSSAESKLSVIAKSIGAVNASDVLLAKASKAKIIAFKTEVKADVLKNAETWDVQISRYDIIYQILDDINQEIHKALAPKEKEISLGRAEIREIFVKHKIGTIAGCLVTDGLIKKDAKCILWRNGVQIYTSTIQSIRQLRDDKREVKAGQECGIIVNKFIDFRIGDVIECMQTVKIEEDETSAYQS